MLPPTVASAPVTAASPPLVATATIAPPTAVTTATSPPAGDVSTTSAAPAPGAASTAPAPTPALPTPAAPPADADAAEPEVRIGSIAIPRMHLDTPLFEGVTLTTLDRGPGHWPGTAMPGDVGNVVIAGHRVSHSKPFRHLDDLVPGDDVVLTTATGTFHYTVVSSEVVTPDALHIVDQTPARTATLFACTPPGSTRFRLVVHLELRT